MSGIRFWKMSKKMSEKKKIKSAIRAVGSVWECFFFFFWTRQYRSCAFTSLIIIQKLKVSFLTRRAWRVQSLKMLKWLLHLKHSWFSSMTWKKIYKNYRVEMRLETCSKFLSSASVEVPNDSHGCREFLHYKGKNSPPAFSFPSSPAALPAL